MKNLPMKKALRAVLLVLLLGVVGMTKANPVDMRTAREVAVKFVNANTKVQLRNADELQLVTIYNISRGDAAFYVFNTPNGFVIVSADDCATPILGYSDEGQFDTENIPIQLQDYLQGFVEQIEYGIENHVVADEKTVQEWEYVRRTGRLTENRDGEVVEPLITALWDQGCYYNAMCPEDENGPCGHCVTGCVATAMAQILHYWGYPAQGTGSHTYTPNGYPQQYVNFSETTYDWANMTDQLTETSTQAEIDAVSTLLWHCGAAVNMGYGPYVSGAAPDSPIYALTNYFDYADDMHWESKQDDDLWISLLKADLNLGRPIYYGGYYTSSTGHAFVCDGYDVNDRFHFNWGWNGSSNGYFALNAIEYYGQQAIIGLHPNAGTIHQVTASASPSDGGTVIGAGLYDIGSICTLTATANENYAFMYWTEDDEIVSTQAEYSFCVRKDRDLVAHFAALFHIDVVTIPMEGGSVSGTGEYAYGSTCTLTATANEGYTFVNWTRNGVQVSTETVLSFTVKRNIAFVANFEANTITQTTTLTPGWNWWSSYIELSDIDGLGQLKNSIGIPRVVIQSKGNGYVKSIRHNGQIIWQGALSSINNEEMYKIGTKVACTATVEGNVTVPANHPITINKGWNWIGFPCSQSVSVNVAMSGFIPRNNDVIKGKDGYATYSNGTWSGTLNTLEPGQGYMYGSKSNTSKTLVFQTGRGEATNTNITPENNFFQPSEDYADNMTVIAVVELDGEELRSDNYELAAFAGDECRGSVKLMYVEPIDRYVAFLTVFGDQKEDLHFRLTDGVATSLSTNRLTYATDDILGSLDNPVVLHFSPMDVDENASADVRIYPNPSEGIFNIAGQNIMKVEVFNAFGQPVYSKDTKDDLMMIDLTDRAAGIYLIRVIIDNGIWSHQVMKR